MEKIIVQIMDETGTAISEKSPSPFPSSNKTDISQTTKSGKKDKESAAKFQVFWEFAQKTWNDVKSDAEYGVGNWYSREEDYIGQTNVEKAKEAISIASSIGKAAAAGFEAGGTVGAVVGVALSVGQTIINARKTVVDEYSQLDSAAYSQYYNSKRAGLVNGSKGTQD